MPKVLTTEESEIVMRLVYTKGYVSAALEGKEHQRPCTDAIEEAIKYITTKEIK